MTPADVTDDLAAAYARLKDENERMRAEGASLEARARGVLAMLTEVHPGALPPSKVKLAIDMLRAVDASRPAETATLVRYERTEDAGTGDYLYRLATARPALSEERAREVAKPALAKVIGAGPAAYALKTVVDLLQRAAAGEFREPSQCDKLAPDGYPGAGMRCTLAAGHAGAHEVRNAIGRLVAKSTEPRGDDGAPGESGGEEPPCECGHNKVVHSREGCAAVVAGEVCTCERFHVYGTGSTTGTNQ